MLAALLPLVLAGRPAESASDYFPTVQGMSWTYSEKAGREEHVFTDKIGKPTKLLDVDVVPMTTLSQGEESPPTYYLVKDDTVYIVFRTIERKEVDGDVVRTPKTYQYPILKVAGRAVEWNYVGKTEFMKSPADMVLKGRSRPVGKRKVLGQDVECVQVDLDVMFGGQGEPPIKSVQSCVYGKGIGLVEMTQTTTVNKQKYSEKRTLVSMDKGDQ